MVNKEHIISSLALEPHPEGGYYRRTYETGKCVDSDKNPLISTCIYFLIEAGNPSTLHKINVDEYWMYHYGNSDVVIKGFSDESKAKFSASIGNICMNWQHLVPKNTWFGAKVLDNSEGAFALVSCVCTPGFDFSGFQLGDRSTLLHLFPMHSALIQEFCPNR